MHIFVPFVDSILCSHSLENSQTKTITVIQFKPLLTMCIDDMHSTQASLSNRNVRESLL